MPRSLTYVGIGGVAGVLGAIGLGWGLLSDSKGDIGEEQITVYKTPSCECCDHWEEHLREAGFDVESVIAKQQQINQVRYQHGITPELVSCHTGVIEGYAVEGHVPAEDIKSMLEERPDIAGLAVPRMPIGSPGMEVPGAAPEPFDVIAFQEDGQTRVFNHHSP
ncbi:DUF411 domain-containing protein [Halorhodospira halochloris]|uniref:DUF411 domain-containing protein n=1 Tax=Halorhodospira halochloris TaxID=1052 RepID=UPI001EE87DAD|nr:DUF411 domain-containing protein [Halorhodospira halochloris]MCG5548491.1 DUF411 domain-containing protein [Halorhodospira halochloris]